MVFPRFLIAGAVNTGVTYVLYLGLLALMPYVWAYTLTYVAGIGLGYALNSRWVFRKSYSLHSVMAYPLTYLLNYLLGLGLLWILVDSMKVPQEIAPLLVVALSVPLMYLVTRSIFQGGKVHEDANNK